MSVSNNNLPIIRPDAMRYEFRQVVGGNALDKPTSGEKFKRFFAKLVSWGSGIGSAVARFFGPIGMAASAGLYGVKSFADRATARMDEKRAQDAALDESAASMQGTEFEAPGFNAFYANTMNGQGVVTPSSPNVQWAPNAEGFQREITTSLNNKSAMTSDMLGQLS